MAYGLRQAHLWASSEPAGSAPFWAHLERNGFWVTSSPRAPKDTPPLKTPESTRIGKHFADIVLKEAHRTGLIRGDPETDRYWSK
jgi:hypothetical protein